MKKRLLLAALSGALVSSASGASADDLAVVASIRPVHALVAGVMDGVGEPELLVPPGASPHTFSLRPGDAKVLQDADVVFYVGANLETFLDRPLASLAGDAQVVDLQEAPGVTVLPLRSGGWWDEHVHEAEEGHGHHDDHDHHDHHDHAADHDEEDAHEAHHHDEGHGGEAAVDPHLWLDPANARAWVGHIAEALAEADPANAPAYRANAEAMSQRLVGLEAELEQRLAEVRDIPYLVFHDAYQYFENRFRLGAVGSIVVDPEVEPSARRVHELREKVREAQAVCVFAEPQFEPKLVGTVVEKTPARTGVLDPVGTDIPGGPDLYFALLRGLAADLRDCLLR